MTSETGIKQNPTLAEREAALDEMLSALRSKTSRSEPKEAPAPAIGIIGSLSAEGIFLGQYTPKDSDGISLSKTFNVFAATQDLTDKDNKKVLLTFNNAVKRVGELKNWHGHDGGTYANEKDVNKAIKDGSIEGKWFIPIREMLSGKDVDGKDVQKDHLYKHQNEGSFKGTFTTEDYGSDFPVWYWSSTENRVNSSDVHNVRFSDGNEYWNHKDVNRLSCRPVRLVAAPSLG